MFARQAPYHLSRTDSPFIGVEYFRDRVLLFEAGLKTLSS
jgi:hypothetical protein